MESKNTNIDITEKNITASLLECINRLPDLHYPFFHSYFFTGLTSQGHGYEKIILFFALLLIAFNAWSAKLALQGELIWKKNSA